MPHNFPVRNPPALAMGRFKFAVIPSKDEGTYPNTHEKAGLRQEAALMLVTEDLDETRIGAGRPPCRADRAVEDDDDPRAP